ncbi:hypothetical protein C7420_103509 [Pantoea ananatis]|jgi:hypothetical protein|nr:hypothetical protein C7420_103509 [Pantoea ananatis]
MTHPVVCLPTAFFHHVIPPFRLVAASFCELSHIHKIGLANYFAWKYIDEYHPKTKPV